VASAGKLVNGPNFVAVAFEKAKEIGKRLGW